MKLPRLIAGQFHPAERPEPRNRAERRQMHGAKRYFHNRALAGAMARRAAYQTPNSLLFRGGQYFSFIPSVAGTTSMWAVSFWMRLTSGNPTTPINILTAGNDADNRTAIQLASSGGIAVTHVHGGATVAQKITTPIYRDGISHYHVMVIWDTGNATESNRIRIYVNGLRITALATDIPVVISQGSYINSKVMHRIGTRSDLLVNYFTGTLSEFVFAHDSPAVALTPSAFGEFDPVTGNWRPKSVRLSYWGTNGYHLGKPWDSSWLGQDYSGVQNIAGLNSAASVLPTTATSYNNNGTNSWQGALANGPIKVGQKVSWVVVPSENHDSNNVSWSGVALGSANLSNSPAGSDVWGQNNFGMTSGQALEVLVDRVAHTIEVKRNGVSAYTSAIPATGLLWPAVFAYNQYGTVDFGQGSYTPPTGYSKLMSGNNWAASGFAASDVLLDSPTNVYATLNPLDAPTGYSLADGNLKVTTSGSVAGRYASTLAVTSGKYVAEFVFNSYSGPTPTFTVGVVAAGGSPNSPVWLAAIIAQNYGIGSGDIVYVALDATAKAVAFYKNAATTPFYTATYTSTAPIMFAAGKSHAASDCTITANFGQRPFYYTLPVGYKTLCTANLPTPTSAAARRPAAYYRCMVRNHNGTSTAIALNVDDNGRPTGWDALTTDWLVRVKNLSTGDWAYIDTKRGLDKYLIGNGTSAEATNANLITGRSSTGFNLGGGFASGNYLIEVWRVAPEAGFDIVTYTGNGVDAKAHNNGTAVALMVVKSRDVAASTGLGWPVYHKSFSSIYEYMFMDSSDMVRSTNGVNYWAGKPPTATNFYVGSYLNVTNEKYVAYVWSEVPGFSAFGPHVGNGSADGPFDWLGFSVGGVTIKQSYSPGGYANGWWNWTAARPGYNGAAGQMTLNTSNAENTSTTLLLDQLSGGIKVRGGDTGFNESGGTYVWFAWAKAPLGASNITPATAR